MQRDRFSNEYLLKGILEGNKLVLSKAITLAESTLPEDTRQSGALLNHLQSHKTESTRVAITGPPGVGKSTFIESLGLLLLSEGKKVAVLSIDPTSPTTGGSILGDKTRMVKLATAKGAYIRPSPSKISKGVGHRTREAIYLCEAAGFNVIIIETVGVGQTETEVKTMVDFFLLMLMPGSGDELQGIKRGIMEIADGIAVNKSDLMDEAILRKTISDLESALMLFHDQERIPKILPCSSITGTGIREVWMAIFSQVETLRKKDDLIKVRSQQQLDYFRQLLERKLLDNFFSDPAKKKEIRQCEENILKGKTTVQEATDHILTK